MIEQAKNALDDAEYVVILAGAGMSAELGLPVYYKGKDARYGEQVMPSGFTVMEHANAELWETHRELQIQFFHESLQQILTIPIDDQSNHYHILYDYLKFAQKKYFVMTSNVDRAFARSGFAESRIYEIHGSRLKSQCLDHPEHGVFPTLVTHEKTMCPICGGDTRPNVMFFGDYFFNTEVELKQQNNYAVYRSNLIGRKTVVLEIGAGTTVATIRNQSAILNHHFNATVIRINTDLANDVPELEWTLPPSEEALFLELPLSASEGIKAATGFDGNKSHAITAKPHTGKLPSIGSF